MSPCSYLLPHPASAVMVSINYFIMFAHCSSVECVRLTPTLGWHVPLTEVSMDSLQMTQFIDSGTFQHILLLPVGFYVLWFYHCSLIFFLSCPYSSACHIFLLYQETCHLYNTNKSFVCHSGYCASYCTFNVVLALGDMAVFSSPLLYH